MILDYVDKLNIPVEDAEQNYNELRSLNRLSIGLRHLNVLVESIESEIGESSDNLDYQSLALGKDPRLKGVPQDLVACAFDWYSVTACSYVRLVGWLVNGGDIDEARNYLYRVLPEVSVWRNKVGAHFAQTLPSDKDTEADLVKSVMYPVAYKDGAFYTQPFVLALVNAKGGSTSRSDMTWSLTHTHRQLSSRYWPSRDSNGGSN